MEKLKLADTYYHLKLVPVYFEKDQDIEVFIKGDKLALFLANVGGAYRVKVSDVNMNGFVLR